MATPKSADSAIRVVFELGPWRSPHIRGWQQAYDHLMKLLTDARVPIHGVLEASLARGEVGDTRWRTQFAANAAYVITRYKDSIASFELLPGPNYDRADRTFIPPESFARTLAAVYRKAKTEIDSQGPTLVIGAVAVENHGIEYLTQTLKSNPRLATLHGQGKFSSLQRSIDGIAIWLALPDDPGPVPTSPLLTQIDNLIQALNAFENMVDIPLYISGFTWRGQYQHSFEVKDIKAALGAVLRDRSQVYVAARSAALVGPIPAPGPRGELDVWGSYAIFTPDSRPSMDTGPRPAFEVANRFDFPVSPRDQPQPPSDYEVDYGLVDEKYYEWRALWHTGEDWNRLGPTVDSDLGEPVYAVANGIVVEAKYFPVAWGNIVLLEHTLPSGVALWTQYAHLREMLVQKDQIVARGQQIGTIGKGAPPYWPAHLHFEVRHVSMNADIWDPWVKNKTWVLENYLPPTDFIHEHRTGLTDTSGIIVRSETGEQEGGSFSRSNTPNWHQSYFGWNFGIAIYTFASRIETDYGQWQARLPSNGRYEVQVWIPGYHATTGSAEYIVHHSTGTTTCTVNQNNINDQWVTLGAYDFNQDSAMVRLTDKTGESDNLQREVCFDTVRWLAPSA